MKKIFFLLSVLVSFAAPRCFAIDHSHDLLSLVSISRETATQDKITSMFGQPVSIKENKKKVWWQYAHDSVTLVICWNKKSDLFENFSYTCKPGEKCTFDTRLSSKLQSGSTSIQQAIKLLGTPADMKIKGETQEMHYAYRNNVLRLFFRDRVLVDYTLLGAPDK